MSGILFVVFRSVRISLWSFIGGTLIDADHLYDYARHSTRSPLHAFDLREFFRLCYNIRLRKLYLFLHSWELVAAILISGAILRPLGDYLIPLGFGMATHMLLDAMMNPLSVVNYSFAVRYRNRFSGERLYKR